MKTSILLILTVLLCGCVDQKPNPSKGILAFDSEDYATAFAELSPLAASGNRVALFYVAEMYAFGLDVPKDRDLAFSYYKDSAEKDYAEAQHQLGLMYLNGQSVEKDTLTGFEWIAKAAEQELDVAQYTMGIALSMEGSPLPQDIAKGLYYFKAAADQNYPKALTQLGEYYGFRELNHVKAGEYFDKAAALGDPQAMHRLSYAYMDGTVRTQDKQKAHNLLKDLAEKGYLPSYYDLAMSYIWGNGVKQNAVKGVEWMKKSATKASDARAMESLAQILLEHRAGYLAQVKVLDSIESGIEWRKKAAELGDAEAQHNLFIQYYNGDYEAADKAQAIKWLKTSAENGFPIAQFELGKMYSWGEDLPKDYQKAITLYESAAEKGIEMANHRLGGIYFAGLGVEINHQKALEWLNPVGMNISEAASLIGMIYYSGKDVKIDRNAAEFWITQSQDPELLAVLPSLYINKKYGNIDLDKAEQLALEIIPKLSGDGRALVAIVLWSVYQKNDQLEDSMYWLTEAANLGNLDAAEALGGHFLVDRYWNLEKSRKWFKKAALAGSPDAAFGLATTYMYNASDLTKARYWFEIAGSGGNAGAESVLVELDAIEKEERQRLVKAERLAAAAKAKKERQRLEEVERQRVLAYQERQREKSEAKTNWLGLLVGAAIVGYAVNKYDKKKRNNSRSKSYDLSKTKGMSSTNLGKELLRQKAEKGISGRGYVAPYQQPSIGYNPNTSFATNTADVLTHTSEQCAYLLGGKKVYITKQNSWTPCPSNLNLPNRLGDHFDLNQMGQSSGTRRILDHGRSATSADYCYYSGNVQIPKANYGSCPSDINY